MVRKPVIFIFCSFRCRWSEKWSELTAQTNQFVAFNVIEFFFQFKVQSVDNIPHMAFRLIFLCSIGEAKDAFNKDVESKCQKGRKNLISAAQNLAARVRPLATRIISRIFHIIWNKERGKSIDHPTFSHKSATCVLDTLTKLRNTFISNQFYAPTHNIIAPFKFLSWPTLDATWKGRVHSKTANWLHVSFWSCNALIKINRH